MENTLELKQFFSEVLREAVLEIKTEIENQTLSIIAEIKQEFSGNKKASRKVNFRTQEYLSAKEVAQLLGESVRTIYDRVQKREIPCYKPNGKRTLKFKRDDIIEWIKEGKEHTQKELKQIIG